MSSSPSQSLPPGKDPPDNFSISSPVTSPRLPSASLQPEPHEEEQQETSTMPRRLFSPFFTLIDDATNSSTHHPVHVQYIFSDDEQDPLTSACLASIPGPSSQSSSGLTARSVSSSITSSREQPSRSQRLSSRGDQEPEHRTILLDLDETGTSVMSAHSLSSSWQILSTSLTAAPTWETSPTGDKDAVPARLMLRIEGIQGNDGRKESDKAVGRSKEHDRDVGPEDFQALVDDFEKRMNILRTVVEAGDKRFGVEIAEEGGEDEGDGHMDGIEE